MQLIIEAVFVNESDSKDIVSHMLDYKITWNLEMHNRDKRYFGEIKSFALWAYSRYLANQPTTHTLKALHPFIGWQLCIEYQAIPKYKDLRALNTQFKI